MDVVNFGYGQSRKVNFCFGPSSAGYYITKTEIIFISVLNPSIWKVKSFIFIF